MALGIEVERCCDDNDRNVGGERGGTELTQRVEASTRWYTALYHYDVGQVVLRHGDGRLAFVRSVNGISRLLEQHRIEQSGVQVQCNDQNSSCFSARSKAVEFAPAPLNAPTPLTPFCGAA